MVCVNKRTCSVGGGKKRASACKGRGYPKITKNLRAYFMDGPFSLKPVGFNIGLLLLLSKDDQRMEEELLKVWSR